MAVFVFCYFFVWFHNIFLFSLLPCLLFGLSRGYDFSWPNEKQKFFFPLVNSRSYLESASGSNPWGSFLFIFCFFFSDPGWLISHGDRVVVYSRCLASFILVIFNSPPTRFIIAFFSFFPSVCRTILKLNIALGANLCLIRDFSGLWFMLFLQALNPRKHIFKCAQDQNIITAAAQQRAGAGHFFFGKESEGEWVRERWQIWKARGSISRTVRCEIIIKPWSQVCLNRTATYEMRTLRISPRFNTLD